MLLTVGTGREGHGEGETPEGREWVRGRIFLPETVDAGRSRSKKLLSRIDQTKETRRSDAVRFGLAGHRWPLSKPLSDAAELTNRPLDRITSASTSIPSLREACVPPDRLVATYLPNTHRLQA